MKSICEEIKTNPREWETFEKLVARSKKVSAESRLKEAQERLSITENGYRNGRVDRKHYLFVKAQVAWAKHSLEKNR